MSETLIAKKESEENDLILFLREHERVTGIETRVIARRERPDFEVRRREKTFGMELVQVVEEPGKKFWRAVLDGRDGMIVSDASDSIQEAIYQKEKKRQSSGWAFPDATVLVVHLKDGSGKDAFAFWDEPILSALCDTGFVEIWLCDHAPEEPYGTVELIGIKPATWRGVHRHSMFGSKPYG